MSSTKVSELDSKSAEKETTKPKRKISSPPLDLMLNGKTNLAFVPEECEDELHDEHVQATEHKNIKNLIPDTDGISFSNNEMPGNINKLYKNGEAPVTKKDPSILFEENCTLKQNSRRHTSHSIDLRRSSGRSDIILPERNNNNRGSVNSMEVRRQARPFKKFSRAWSQLSFHPQQNQQEPVYELQGMEMEVRKLTLPK